MKNPQSRLVRFGPLTAILCSFPAVGCVVSHAPQHDVESDDALTQSACTEPGSPPKTFSKLYGGSSTDRFAAVQQARNGRIIMAGSTSSFGAGGYDDVWLVEADAKGRKVWDKTFGGSETDQANAVQQTSDGGYIVAGVTQSFGAGMGDGWLIKTDRKGNKIWDRTFGGTGPDEIRAVRQTRDGGYILAGYSESSGDHGGDAWLIKTDAAGNKVWEKTFGGANTSFYNQDSANAVQETSNGDYVLAGFTTVAFPSGTWSTDAWLIKTDRKGNKIWDRTFGGTGESHSDSANAVQQTRDGGYILAGRTNSYAVVEPDVWAPDDAWLIKTDADGNMLWNKAFGGTSDDSANAVQQTEDGGYVLAGATSSFVSGSERNAWLIKTNARGKKIWDKSFGGMSGMNEAGAVQQTKDGGYILAGVFWSSDSDGEDAWLIRTTAGGNAPKTPTR